LTTSAPTVNLPASVQLPAPLVVAVEIRRLDAGARTERVWRTSSAIGEPGLRLRHPVPYEIGRPVAISLRFPEDDGSFVAQGKLAGERPAAKKGEDDSPRATLVAFTSLDAGARERLLRYLEERMSTP
jgi:hypothetical protein